jgi:hypothetical protein
MNPPLHTLTSPDAVRGLAEARSALQDILQGSSPKDISYGCELTTCSYSIMLAGGGPSVHLSGRLSDFTALNVKLTYSNFHAQDVEVPLTPSQQAAALRFAQWAIDAERS